MPGVNTKHQLADKQEHINDAHSAVTCGQLYTSYFEQLYPAFLLGLDAQLNLGVCLNTHTAEGSHVLLTVLRFSLGVGQLDDTQARVP